MSFIYSIHSPASFVPPVASCCQKILGTMGRLLFCWLRWFIVVCGTIYHFLMFCIRCFPSSSLNENLLHPPGWNGRWCLLSNRRYVCLYRTERRIMSRSSSRRWGKALEGVHGTETTTTFSSSAFLIQFDTRTEAAAAPHLSQRICFFRELRYEYTIISDVKIFIFWRWKIVPRDFCDVPRGAIQTARRRRRRNEDDALQLLLVCTSFRVIARTFQFKRLIKLIVV